MCSVEHELWASGRSAAKSPLPGHLRARASAVRTLTNLALALALLSGGSPAASQEPPGEAVEVDDHADAARERFARAKELYRQGKRAASIIELRRAHELRPSPKLFRMIAEISEEMHDYAGSLDAWRRYQAEMGDRLDQAERQHVETRLRVLRGYVAELQITGGESEARVWVDDEPIGTLPLSEPVLLNAGRHTVRVQKQGFMPFSQVVNVAGGDPVRVEVVLERPGRVANGLPERGPQHAAEDTGKQRMTKWSWVGFGGAATLGAAGAITGVLALRADRRGRDQTFAGDEPSSSVTRDLEEARRLGLATDVLVGAGVTTALITAYFTWIHPSDKAAAGGKVRAGLGPGQAWVGGVF